MAQELQGKALITGASSGIGAIYADRLAKRGYDLVLVARNGGRLGELAKRISKQTGRTVETLTADLNDTSDLRSVETVLQADEGITMLVNNAGVGASGSLLASDINTMERMISLNVTALTRLTYAAVPRLVARGSGTIINIASIVAVAPEVLNGVYGASKAFVVAFSQSLIAELKDKNIRIQAVLPGATATDFWEKAGTPLAHLPSEIVMSGEDMVDAALAGLDLGEHITIPSLPDASDWKAYEAARQTLMPNLSLASPATRYRRPSAVTQVARTA